MMDILVSLGFTALDKEKRLKKDNYDYVIEPDEPIKSEGELINALINWGNSTGKKIDIESVSKSEMITSVEGKKYIVKLESAKDDTFMANRGMMTYKCIYLYKTNQEQL